MATAAQVSANRRNAGKSTGPKTTVGKAVVAQNALKHGLLARQNVVLGEDPQQFDLSRRQWLDEITPVGNAETTLAERIAGLAWRLKRAERLQNELFDFLLTKELEDSMKLFDDELPPRQEAMLRGNPSTDPGLAVGRMLKRDYAHERGLERLMMYERWIENSLYRSMKELRQVQRERKADGGDGEGASRAAGPRRASVPARPLVCRDARPPIKSGAGSTEETPCGVTTSGPDSAKQSQFAPPEGGHSPPYEAPSNADFAKQSQFAAVEDGQSSRCEAHSEADFAKQSQSPGSAARALPRSVRRAAWHCHNLPRSY